MDGGWSWLIEAWIRDQTQLVGVASCVHAITPTQLCVSHILVDQRSTPSHSDFVGTNSG